MKFILLSDIHILKSNPICRTDNVAKISQYEKFEYVLKYSVENGYPIFSAGDQTDSSRDFETLERMTELFEKYKPEFYCVFGQHDMYLRSEKASIMTVLSKMGYAKRLGDTPLKIAGMNIYGCDFGCNFIPAPKTKNNVLVIHAGITMPELANKNFDFINAIDFLNQNELFDLILCGDIHKRFIYEIDGRIICNTGPIVRKDSSEYFINYKPKFFLFDTETSNIRQKTIPHNKGVVRRDHIAVKDENSAMKAFSAEINNHDDSLFDFDVNDIINALIKENKIPSQVSDIIFNYEEEK